jgi:ATP-binding cassette subfamily F protein 3
MLLSVDISEKSFGDKSLYHDLRFEVQPGEVVGLIGRNGTGKSTLFSMILGSDSDYQGEIITKRNSILVSSRQEHHGLDGMTVLEYIQSDLPEFAELAHIIDTYPEQMGDNLAKINIYSDALERFSQLGYYQIEDEISQLFEAYQIDPAKLHGMMGDLSGGQKRMVELIKVQRSRGDLALIDEPTNHMDYVAKQAFIKWLGGANEAVLVITHDRDVLRQVDRIIEIRDGQAYAFRGNYDQYLKINANKVTNEVNEFDLTQRRIVNLQENVIRFRRMKERARDPGTIKRFKSQEEKAEAELERLQKIKKPSFWIDQESAGDLSQKMANAYEKYKAQNIQLDAKQDKAASSRLLVQVSKLSLGYDDKPLFSDISFELREGERIRLHGRNGAGKTTLVDAIMAKADDAAAAVTSQSFGGSIAVEREITVGHYEQEIDEKYLPLSLYEALENVLRDKDLPVNDQHIRQLLSNYLFTPNDGAMPVAKLSGGQKARFQLIRMLANNPLLLILDEPTNHLDLPSIEELERALTDYHGAVIYISHDSFFADKLGGTTVAIGAAK